MRPQSEIRVCLSAALMEGPGTTKQLAQRTGWSIGMTMTALHNMVRAGDAKKLPPVRVPGVSRPVPVYARALRSVDAAAGSSQPMQSLIAAWAGLARPVQMGEAM